MKRDRHGFWMSRLGEVDNSLIRNLFVFPGQVMPVSSCQILNGR